MIVKKITQEITYKEVVVLHTFEINGKEVRAYEYKKTDYVSDDYETDLSIDKDDSKNLTNIEYEAIGENLDELIELRNGQEIDYE